MSDTQLQPDETFTDHRFCGTAEVQESDFIDVLQVLKMTLIQVGDFSCLKEKDHFSILYFFFWDI